MNMNTHFLTTFTISYKNPCEPLYYITNTSKHSVIV